MQKCRQGDSKDTYTLHGIWPDWTQDCSGPKFDISVLAPIRSEMEAKWLSCPEYAKNNEEFWTHEWEKHGTCSGMEMLDYFKKGLSLRDQHFGECKHGTTCAICFDKEFKGEETCN